MSNKVSAYLLLRLAPLFWTGNVVIGRATAAGRAPRATPTDL